MRTSPHGSPDNSPIVWQPKQPSGERSDCSGANHSQAPIADSSLNARLSSSQVKTLLTELQKPSLALNRKREIILQLAQAWKYGVPSSSEKALPVIGNFNKYIFQRRSSEPLSRGATTKELFDAVMQPYDIPSKNRGLDRKEAIREEEATMQVWPTLLKCLPDIQEKLQIKLVELFRQIFHHGYYQKDTPALVNAMECISELISALPKLKIEKLDTTSVAHQICTTLKDIIKIINMYLDGKLSPNQLCSILEKVHQTRSEVPWQSPLYIPLASLHSSVHEIYCKTYVEPLEENIKESEKKEHQLETSIQFLKQQLADQELESNHLETSIPPLKQQLINQERELSEVQAQRATKNKELKHARDRVIHINPQLEYQ